MKIKSWLLEAKSKKQDWLLFIGWLFLQKPGENKRLRINIIRRDKDYCPFKAVDMENNNDKTVWTLKKYQQNCRKPDLFSAKFYHKTNK